MGHQILSISSFKKFLLRVLIPYGLIIVVVGTVFNYFFVKKIILGSEISGSYKINRIINENNKNEIPFFGSSRCEQSFIPDSLVSNGFNYGLSGIQDDVLIFFLREECRKREKKTPIVVNFDLDGLNYSLGDESYYIYNADNPAVRKLLDTNFRYIYKVPLLKYYGHFELYTKYYLNNRTNFTQFTNKGASAEKNVLSKEKFEAMVNDRLKTTTVFENDKKLRSDLLEIINSNKNRKFIFIVTPYHKSCFKLFPNLNEAESFLDFLGNFDNVAVLNFSKMDYPDEYFINTTHLNLKGTFVFDRMLKDTLAELIRN